MQTLAIDNNSLAKPQISRVDPAPIEKIRSGNPAESPYNFFNLVCFVKLITKITLSSEPSPVGVDSLLSGDSIVGQFPLDNLKRRGIRFF
jgi:hypothetical protein